MRNLWFVGLVLVGGAVAQPMVLACEEDAQAGQVSPERQVEAAGVVVAAATGGGAAGNGHVPGERWVDPDSGIGFRYVPGGSWTMGSPEDEPGRRDNEVVHEVTLSGGLWVAETEVTQGQWERIMGGNPSRFTDCGATCPVESMTWHEALALCNALSRKAGLTECYSLGEDDGGFVGLGCEGYRLPTEAEWERAARAGTTTALYTGPLTIVAAGHGPELDPIAWYGGNSGVEYASGADCSGWKARHRAADRCGPHPVAGKQPNPWGLHDMLGNVWEMTGDGTRPMPSAGVFEALGTTDPLAMPTDPGRVVRGCAWDSGAAACRVANRGSCSALERSPTTGVRPVRSASAGRRAAPVGK